MEQTIQRKRLSDLHFENQLWLSEIEFFKLELRSLEARLGEVVNQNTDHYLLSQADQFQNRFIIQQSSIAELLHLIKEHEHWLAKFAKEHPVAIDKVEFADHTILREKYVSFKKSYSNTKSEFLKNLINWM